MIKKLLEKVPRSISVAGFGGALLIAFPLLAQDTNAPTVLKPTVVTGSYIPTAETVGPAPVQTLSSEAIEQAGQADALLTLKKTVPAFTGSGNYLGSVNNNVNIGAGFQAFTGQSYASLRNLPTLVLLDGQRVVSTGLSGAQAVDLNTIPLAMIERVEVLKDGASAIYGSDAIGGVINVITKKNWNGFEIGGRFGFPTASPQEQGMQYQAYFSAGASTEKTRFFAGAQIYHQNPLQADRRLIGSQGIEQLAGQNVVPPSYVSPSYPGKVQSPAIYQPGTLDPNTGLPVRLEPATSYLLAGSPFAAGAAGYNPAITSPPVVGGTFGPNYFTFTDADGVRHRLASQNPVEAYNAAAGRAIYIPIKNTPAGEALASIGSGEASAWPLLNTTDYGVVSILEQDRRQFWANLEHDLYEDKLTIYSRFLYSDNTAQGQLAPSPAPSLNTSAMSVPADNPYNPFGIPLGVNGFADPRVRYRFVDFGNRTFDTFQDFYQWIGGFKGNVVPELSYDVSFNYGRERSEQQTRNAVNGAGLNQAMTPLTVGGIIQSNSAGLPLSLLTDASGNNLPVFNPFVPFLTAGSSGNAPETINQLRTTLFTWAQSELYSGQGVFNYRPVDLPAGKLNVAFGAQYIHEQLALQVDGLTQLGLVPGLNAAQNFSGGARETTAGFIEVGIPILGKDQDIPGFYSLELNVAGRYQTFSPGGDKAIPKVALRWQPLDDQFTLRGSYGQGFIAPSIWNLFGPDFISNPNVTIDGAPGQVQTQTRANPNLKPSDSEQFNAGIVISPHVTKGLTVGVDWYHVTENHLPIADAQGAANSLNALGSASPFAPGFTFNDGTTLVSPRPGQVSIDNWGNLIIPWSPAGALRTEGLDFSLNYVLPLDQRFGKVTLGTVANYILNYEVSTGTGRPYFDYTGTFTPFQGLIPRYNITASLTYEYDGWTGVVMAHYLPGISDPGGLFPEYNLGEQGFTINNTDKPFEIPNYYTIDLQVSYEFGKGKLEGRKWYDGSKFTVGCNNVFDMTPRLIADGVEDNTDKNNYDVLGRFVYFEVSKKF